MVDVPPSAASQGGAGGPIEADGARDAGSGVGRWISYQLALTIVAKAGGLDLSGAIKWLRNSSLPPRPVLRARVSPGALAQWHLKIKREGRLLRHPDRALILSGHFCAWLPPDEALARRKGFETVLGMESVQWREDELCAALARAFPAVPHGDERSLTVSPEPALWTPFVLARAEAAKALGYPDDVAAEWLRRAALEGRIRVRFSERYVKLHPINLRLGGHPANLTEEERALPWPQPVSPLDDLKQGPAAMAEHRIIYETEWDASQLRAALGLPVEAGAAPVPAQRANPAKADREGIGGADRQYPWDELGAAFGAWLHDQPGRANLRPGQHQKALEVLAGKLGCEIPPRSTARPYLIRWVVGYRSFLKNGD